MISGGFIVLVPLVLLVGYIIVEGIKALRLGFFLHDQAGITPTEPATAGGGSHAIVGTIEQVGPGPDLVAAARVWPRRCSSTSRAAAGAGRSASSSTP